jgi:hypothetical protein
MQVLGHSERRWLGGLGIVTACSWGRFVATGSLKVDENYPAGWAGTGLFLGLVAGWALLVLGWRGMLVSPRPARPRPPRRLAYAGLLLAALMLPMLSNDVFSLFAYGSLAGTGHDVYTTASSLTDTPWYAWVGQHWNEEVCVYGPSTLVGILPVTLAGHSPWAALFLLRIAWFAPLVLVMELSFRRLRDRPLFHAMVWLNPLWIVEGPGQMHGDVLGLVAVVAGIVLAFGGRVRSAWALWAVAVLGKYSFGFTGFWFWLFRAPEWRRRAVRTPAMAAILVGLAIVFFAPFWHGPATILVPVRALGKMNPGGSITEVVGILVNLARGGGVPHADTPVQSALEASRAANAGTWWAVSLVMRVVALAVCARVLAGMIRKPHDDGRVALGTGALVIAVVTLASHRFQSWYLIAALPFFGLRCTEVWRRWWVAVVTTSVATEFVHVLPTTSPILPVWSAVTNGATVVLFLAFFVRRYLAFDSPALALAPLDEQPQGGQERDRGEQTADLADDRDRAQAADRPVV